MAPALYASPAIMAAAAALLNISISAREQLASAPGLLDALTAALRTGAAHHAAATVHSLLCAEAHRAAIGARRPLLAALVAPCFAAEAAYKVWWYATSAAGAPFFGGDVLGDVLACSVEMASWMYRSAVYLLTCVLFRLICHLQGLRLEDFAGTLLEEVEEGRAGIDRVLREHLDIRKQLKVISHRFRKFIVAALLIATASQFASVLLTTRRDSVDDLLNTGELAVSSTSATA